MIRLEEAFGGSGVTLDLDSPDPLVVQINLPDETMVTHLRARPLTVPQKVRGSVCNFATALPMPTSSEIRPEQLSNRCRNTPRKTQW